MPRRALFVLSGLVLLILGACGVSAGPAAAPSRPVPPVADIDQLQQWLSWSAVAAPHRECVADPRSGLWFLAAPPDRAVKWACRLPAGSALLVVATSMSGPDEAECSRDLAEQVGVDGSASLDGHPVALHWLGPLTGRPAAGSHPAPERTCSLAGITVPVAAGHHHLIVQFILGSLSGTATVNVTAT